MQPNLATHGVLFSNTSWHYAVGPLIAILAVAFLTLVLRWSSIRAPRPGHRSAASGDGFGLLVPVATSDDRVELDRLRQAMDLRGVRSTVGVDGAGVPALLVFPTDYATARRLLQQAG